MTNRTLSLVGCLALLSVAAPGARAQVNQQDEEAGHTHFERGVEYVQDGNLNAAMVEFKRAYAASPNYRVLYNLGQVANELTEYTDAQAYFRRYLVDGGSDIDPARRREVEGLIAKLSSRIATLYLSTNVPGAELFVDDTSVGKSPLKDPVRVSAGARVVSAVVNGRPRISQTVEAAGGDTLAVRLEFPPVAVAELPSGRESDSEVARDSGGTSATLLLGIGTGALAVATGVMAYLAAHDAAKYHDAVDRKTTPRELNDLDDRATAKALVTDILLGATVAAATVTIIVAFSTGSSERERASATGTAGTRLTLGAGTLRLSGSF
jgi:tetratricopeptide (TPR) repeat protein